MRGLERLLRPRSIAVIGGGAWCAQVIAQSEKMGFDGAIWPVHPKAALVAGHGAFPSLDDLPEAPDAVFIGVNRHTTVDVVAQLSQMGAGGAVCFASGFAEARAEDSGAHDLQDRLVAAAGDMPILGPNCYGFINALDGALLWPDQHGCMPVSKGVAILTQSSNIAINLTMQQRALPVAYVVTCGNMGQTSQAEIAMALLDDPRVTAIGLHIEGFGALRHWEALAANAHARGVPLIALKVGASDQAQQATVSHTASLAGSDAGAQALLDRLGIARLRALPDFLETLKLLHAYGPLGGTRLASISCSGGEASLIADMSLETPLTFPSLDEVQSTRLRAALGPMVALSNPLDYNTYIWRDAKAMAQAWAGMTGDHIDMTLSIVDYPATDATDWTCATDAALNVRRETGRPFGVVATLPELMPPDVADQLMAGGVIPFFGLREALAAIAAAGPARAPHDLPLCLPGTGAARETLGEDAAKAALSAYGLACPARASGPATDAQAMSQALTAPLATKGLGLAHKTEAGAVVLGLDHADIAEAATRIGTPEILIEEMVTDGIAELLIGVTRDPAHGFVLTLGAGGVLTELLRDSTSLLLPVAEGDIQSALDTLAIAPVLRGYRGKPAADRNAIIRAVLAIQAYVLAHQGTLSEVEVNPLICTPTRAVAVDALIRLAEEP
ncbi:acetate--CoA ligase family protein [uncultured Tateyamaria sp.]|uniref:acetate--CoA ligase family protein n=1 Tax=uncultured Tateyamaria sp. TaxID=455651 RepID=UPI002631C5C4|nr:acetate--CoA ligase family protein [uncultured Tateyamaria sp.]